MSDFDKPRTVKLLCPYLSTTVPFTAWEDQKLDLGSIARAFGLDPSTLKLNGHFISRGVDLISSSVTWRSLLKFFSSKGLSTGQDDADALVVDGKLCKSGTKRAYSPQDAATCRINYRTEPEKVGIRSGIQHGHTELLMNKMLKVNNSGFGADHQVPKYNGLGFKRKQLLEDVNLFKKLKINEANSEFGGGGNGYPGVISSNRLKCGHRVAT